MERLVLEYLVYLYPKYDIQKMTINRNKYDVFNDIFVKFKDSWGTEHMVWINLWDVLVFVNSKIK